MLSAALFSCSSDDNDGGGGSLMKSYTVESKSYLDGETTPFEHAKVRYNLVDGKYHSISAINAATGQVIQTNQSHFYTNGRLMKISSAYSNEDFIYDTAGNLVATEYSDDMDTHIHWRFVTLSPTLSYAEKLTEAYNVPWAMIERRIIMEFDVNNNVITAGDDFDIDGVRDQTNLFSYEYNNLIGCSNYNGEALVSAFSDVINNISEINDKTYGKKIARLVAAEQFARLEMPGHLFSVNVAQAFIDYDDYQILPTGYYKSILSESVFAGGRHETLTVFDFR